MVVQTGLIYNVQYKTSIAQACGIGAAVMLFVFEGAFTIGFQATVSSSLLLVLEEKTVILLCLLLY